MDDICRIKVNKSEMDILNYEIEKLEESYLLCLKRKKEGNKIESGLFLEVFLLHARNLIDFLDGNNKYRGDLTVKNFKDKSGIKIEKIDFYLDKNIKNKIDKHCCHMTKKRLNGKYFWNIDNIKNKIEQGLLNFEELTGLNIKNIFSTTKNGLIMS